MTIKKRNEISISGTGPLIAGEGGVRSRALEPYGIVGRAGRNDPW